MKLPNLFKQKPLDRLEVYMLAADNPIGRKQLRPFFKRKRSKEILTREQVTAIKLGRKVLRQEMKAQGLTSLEDFEVTATNLNLYFDKKGLLWPLILWFGRGNTLAKVLASTVLLTTAVTVSVPVIQEVEKIIKETITQIQKEEVGKFTVDVSSDLYESGFTLSEKPDFSNPTSNLICPPAKGVTNISIIDIPPNVNWAKDGAHHDPNQPAQYFAYTFYCRYENQTAKKMLLENPNADVSGFKVDYDWTVNLAEESRNLSDAVWLMVFEDGRMIFSAESSKSGGAEILPPLTENTRGYSGLANWTLNEDLVSIYPRLTMNNIHLGLENVCVGCTPEEIAGYQQKLNDYMASKGFVGVMLQAKDRKSQYSVVASEDNQALYRVTPKEFEKTGVAQRGGQTDVHHMDVHKYTVVMWLEGDDPECTDDKIGGYIGMNFHITLKGKGMNTELDVNTGSSTPSTP